MDAGRAEGARSTGGAGIRGGNSGSGKSRLAAALARRLGVPHIELDAIVHQRGWVRLGTEEFRRRVAEVVRGDGWVVDGNYSAVRDLVWERADTVVWLDFPRRTVMRRVVGRTMWRALCRRPLWNGNRERWGNLLSLDRERSVIVWAWVQHDAYRRTFQAALTDPAWRHLRFVRLRSSREAEAFLERPLVSSARK
jgi:adenylate kinase family enzyme